MLAFSELSKIEARYTVVRVTFTKVIILAPPDFPFPLDRMASQILKKLLPRGAPCSGFWVSWSISPARSFLREGYFFPSRLACLSNNGMVDML
jgi:hypothetical protein